MCIPTGKKLSSKRDVRKKSQEAIFASLLQETTIVPAFFKSCFSTLNVHNGDVEFLFCLLLFCLFLMENVKQDTLCGIIILLFLWLFANYGDHFMIALDKLCTMNLDLRVLMLWLPFNFIIV